MKSVKNIRVALAGLVICCGTLLAESVILVSQPFNGDGANNLNGSPPPVYHADLAASGGSGVWTGHSLFKQDGSNMNFGGGQSSIALDLGTYLDDQKGKEDALFILQCTIRLEQVGGTQGSKFLTMGFSESDGVNPDQNFTHSDNESLAAVWNQNEPRGPVVRWHGAGANALGSIAGPTVQTRTYTTTIDLRDHNGIDNFGTVHFEVSGLGHLGTWTLAEDHSFRSILLSANDRAPGTFSNLILAKPGPRGSIEATLSHDAMVMRVGFPALIPTGAAYPTLEITSDYEAEGGYELEVIRESDGQVVDSFSGTLQHGESVTLLENTPASEPGTYRLQLKYIQGDRVMYEAFYFTVGLEQLREHLSGFSNFSEIVFPGPDGQMIYIPDFRGNHIPDFSRVGYKAGREPIPDVPVRVTLSPLPGDNAPQIQAAIDEVSAMDMDENGFRGAVLLTAGVYELSHDLLIESSGVVLRGVGSGSNKQNMWLHQDDWLDPDKNKTLEDFKAHLSGTSATVLIKSGGSRGLIEARGSDVTTDLENASPVTDKYVPVGAKSFHVEHPERFQAGDQIIVRRKGNPEWIHAIGMDRIPNRDPWGSEFFSMDYERNIVSVDGNQITIDSPVVMAMEERWGGGYIFKYDDSARLTQVGIEGMRVMLYNQMRNGELSHVRGTVVRFNRVRHGWADDVVAEHFYDRVFDVRDSKYITIRDSAVLMAPARYFSGYVPHYGFNLTRGLTSHVLVTGCFTRNNRHAYVLDARVPGPNVFHDSVGAQSRTWSEPHHRWSTGGLYDNVDDLIAFHNRLSSGTGHGWSGVNFVAWNTRGTLASQRPPTAQNWAIGHVGVKSNGSNLNWVPAGDDGSYDGGGHGHWELHRTGGANSVQPKSLYEYQRDLHYSLIIRHTNAGEPLHLPRNHYPFETALAIGEGLQLEASDLSHHWEVVSAPGTYHLQGIGTLTPSIIMSAPGTYTLRVRVYQAGQTEPLEEAFFSVELLPTAESNLTRTATLTDDTFAQNGEPNTNFGSEDILRMKHLSTNQYGRESYLKFTLPDLETFEINSARLRLFSVNSFTEHEGTVVLLDSNNWSEGTLTWDNRPTAGITAATWAHDGTIGWLEIDLDSSALELLSNAGTVSFRLSVDWQSENAPVLNLASKDGPHEANRAQLLIQGAKVYTYADWLQDEGIPEEEQAPELDRFGNGVSNLEAYLTGVSAENPAPPNNHLENSTWHINLPWRNSVPHAYFFIEQSSDLKTWTPLPWDLWQASPLDDQRTRYETSIRMEDILHEPDPGLLFLRLRFAK